MKQQEMLRIGVQSRDPHKVLLNEFQKQLRQYRHNYRSRRQLLQLDDHALKDIGLSRAEAIEEGRKPFWKCAADKKADRFFGVQPAALLSLFCGISLIIVISV